MLLCPLCNSFRGQSFGAVLRHIGDVHRYDPGLNIQCGIGQCPQTYSNFVSFRSHIYRKHRDVLHCDHAVDVNTSNHNSSIDPDPSPDPNQEHDPPGPTEDEEHTQNPPTSASAVAKHVPARFIMKVREEYRIPQSTVNCLLQDVSALCSSTTNTVKDAIFERIEGLENAKQIRSIVVDSIESVNSPFKDLDSEHKQTSYYKKHLDYLEPQERVLGRYMKNKNGQCKPAVDCCYDIDLLDCLRSLLKIASVQEQVMNSHASPDGKLMDYCDGSLFKRSRLFMKDPCALQIQLYYDEVEVCNPIGSFAKKHKLGCVYFTLGNLHPKLRSSLKNIHLLSIVKYSYVVKYGIDIILEPVVEAVKKLEESPGVEFVFDGHPVFFRGTVTVFSADNLAAWSIGGFKALASAFRKCHYCMATQEEVQTEFNESNLKLRTKEVYKEHCRGLDSPIREHISKTFGMVRNSVLNSLQYFHVVRGLVPDVMHDILEGSLKVVTQQLFLQFIVVEKKLSLKTLNDAISSFAYGSDATNKPSVIEPNHITTGQLKQSASQMWCLGRLLPLIIGHLVEENNQYWDNYLLHLDIMDEVFAPVYSLDRIPYLKMIIEDFLHDFKLLYPNRPITPKMHYLVHIPTWIEWVGPLTRMWCMRYEAKHSFFKHLSGVLRNFKNIPKTLATRHQRYMCFQMMDRDKYLRQPTTYTKSSQVDLQELDYFETLTATYPEVVSTNLWRITSASINGTKYTPTQVVCYDVESESNEPLFGVIIDLLVAGHEELFVLRQLNTLCRVKHLHAFQVEEINSVIVLKHHALVDYHPMFIHKKENNSFVCPKYLIIK